MYNCYSYFCEPLKQLGEKRNSNITPRKTVVCVCGGGGGGGNLLWEGFFHFKGRGLVYIWGSCKWGSLFYKKFTVFQLPGAIEIILTVGTGGRAKIVNPKANYLYNGM